MTGVDAGDEHCDAAMSRPIRGLTLGDVLAELARSRPDGSAIRSGDHSSTWSELDQRVDRLAAGLRSLGVESGDIVLWFGQNSHRVLETLLAAGRLGAVLCPVNWRQTAEELAFVLTDAEPRVVIWQDEEIGDVVGQARTLAPTEARWLRHDGPGTSEYEQLIATSVWLGGRPDVDDREPVVMIYTAAFDGRPNGALLSHQAWILQNQMTAIVHGITHESIYLNCGPLFHVGTLRHTLATFQQGGANVFVRRVEAKELCRVIDEERCTGAFLERPTMDQMVVENQDGAYDLSSLRTPPGSPEWNAMVTVDVRPMVSGFGQTELAGVVSFKGLGGPGIGGAGRTSPLAEIDIVDAEGTPLPPGETGEIVVRGPVVMNGYHRRPELNAHRQRGGWHHTNDLGRRESDGSISFIGPATRIVKSASENIYPSEVEGALRSHPAVDEAAVIGIPDPTWGQSVVAIVALATGATATGDELIAHCRERIASYKKPRRIEFVERLPRAGTAVDYDALDEAFGGGGYPSK